MCGIAGFVGFQIPGDEARKRVHAMCDAIAHRGPDADGFHVAEGVALGMRRLSIIDVNGGQQPISNEDGTVTVVFNGEIYNHHGLRRQLEASGHRFRTHSDTEVLVHLYEDHGADMVSRLHGMFAFAIWDSRNRALLLARDRTGMKPLSYLESAGGLAFCSELRSLWALDSRRLRVAPAAVMQYLAFGYVPDPASIFEGVRKLLLGPTGRSFAALPATEGGRLDAEARVDGKTRSVAFFGAVAGGQFSFRLKLDLRGETVDATNAMTNALGLHSQGRYGEFLVAAATALAEYPFANKNTRDQLRKLIDAVNEDYEARRRKIERLRKDYVDFRSREDLLAAAAELAKLEKDFQVAEGAGPRSEYVKGANAEIDRLDVAARQERETKMTEHTFVQATLVDLPEGREFSAALQLYYIVEFAPNSANASAAAAALEQIDKRHPQILRVLGKLFQKR